MKRIEINEIRTISYEILKHIKVICEKNNIIYYIVGGTLLGAVRHKGFIPWDDDIDIAMTRQEYEKFKNVFSLYGDNYSLRDYDDKRYYYNYAKIYDERTIIKEKYVKNMKMGVFVDLFILDTLSGALEVVTKKSLRLDSIRRGINKYAIKPYLRKNIFLFVKDTLIFLTHLLYFGLKRKQMEYIHIVKSQDGGDFLYPTGGSYGKRDIFRKADFEDFIYLPFEDDYFPAPVGWKNILSQIYGDYMTLPPIEKRVSNHTFVAYKK